MVVLKEREQLNYVSWGIKQKVVVQPAEGFPSRRSSGPGFYSHERRSEFKRRTFDLSPI